MMRNAKILFFCAIEEEFRLHSFGVSVSLLYPIMRTMVRKGFDWDTFCKHISIEPSLLQQEEARISEDGWDRIVQEASVFTGDEAFGLHQGMNMNISDLGVLGYVMLHSKTIGKALDAYQKYNLIVCNGFNAAIESQENDIIIRLFLSHNGRQPSRHCIDDMAASLYQIMLGLSGRLIPIKEITFMHGQPPEIDPYVSVLGVLPRFNQNANKLRFHKEVLDYPVVRADTRLLGVFEAIAEEARGKLTQGSRLTNELSKWIIERMPSQYPTLQDAAKEMRMGVRTLQAKLKVENTSYNRLANEVRKELALCYLAKLELTIGEIAYLLHFSEPSSFQSAFRKWTGITPGEYRQRVQRESK